MSTSITPAKSNTRKRTGRKIVRRRNRGAALPSSVDLSRYNRFSLTLTDSKGRSIVRLDFDRIIDDLPQLKIEEHSESGEMKRMTVLFDLKNV